MTAFPGGEPNPPHRSPFLIAFAIIVVLDFAAFAWAQRPSLWGGTAEDGIAGNSSTTRSDN